MNHGPARVRTKGSTRLQVHADDNTPSGTYCRHPRQLYVLNSREASDPVPAFFQQIQGLPRRIVPSAIRRMTTVPAWIGVLTRLFVLSWRSSSTADSEGPPLCGMRSCCVLKSVHGQPARPLGAAVPASSKWSTWARVPNGASESLSHLRTLAKIT